MFSNYFILLCNFFILFGENTCTRVYFSKCGSGGFTCDSGTQNITYQCPNNTDNILLIINEFRGPSDIKYLTLENCNDLTISLRCTSEQKNIQGLHIRNVGSLKIQRLQYQSQLPPIVVIQNVAYVQTIPSFTFSQIDADLHTVGCFIPKKDFNQILLKNITIGTVQSYGFYMPNDFGKITFTNVRINRLQSSSVSARMSQMFWMENSTVKTTESLAFQLSAKEIVFRNNNFTEISPMGINCIVRHFRFLRNTVNVLQPHALSLQSEQIHISENRFKYLKSGAFEKVSSSLPSAEWGNYTSKLKFVYEFNRNNITFMDAGGLHPDPDFQAFDNIPSVVSLKENTIICSCETSAWLFSEIGHGYIKIPTEVFYDSFLDEDSLNSCSNSVCDLPVAKAKMMIRGEKCLENVTTEYMCQSRDDLHSGVWVTPAIADIHNRKSVSKNSSQIFIMAKYLLVFVTISIRAIN